MRTAFGRAIAAALLGLLTAVVVGFVPVAATGRGVGVVELLLSVVLWPVMSAVWWILLARTARRRAGPAKHRSHTGRRMGGRAHLRPQAVHIGGPGGRPISHSWLS